MSKIKNKKFISEKIVELTEELNALASDHMNSEYVEVHHVGSWVDMDSEDVEPLVLNFIKEIDGYGVKVTADILSDVTIEDIKDEINIDNYNNFIDKEEDDWLDSESDDRYQWRVKIVTFRNVEGYHMITIQSSGGEDLDLVYNGAVEKKPVTTYQWV